MVKLSIVIITLNEEKFIGNLLRSIQRQTFQDFEVIVADFNSTDRTREIAREYGCKIVQGGSYSKGRNNGARASSGEDILFLDADCILPEDFLEINYLIFKEKNVGTGTVSLLPLSEKKIDLIFYKLYDSWSKIMSKISPHCAGCGIFSKKEIFNKIGGFDEKIVFGENHDYSRRAKEYGFTILPKPMYTSVRRLDNEGRLRFFMKYIYSGLYRLFFKEINKELFEYNNQR